MDCSRPAFFCDSSLSPYSIGTEDSSTSPKPTPSLQSACSLQKKVRAEARRALHPRVDDAVEHRRLKADNRELTHPIEEFAKQSANSVQMNIAFQNQELGPSFE